MEKKTHTMFKIEKHFKHIENFYKKLTECKNCNSKRSLKRYNDNKVRKANQRKI